MDRQNPEIARKAYSLTEVAKLLGISRTHAHFCAHRGLIPAKKIGGRWLCPAAEIHKIVGSEDVQTSPAK